MKRLMIDIEGTSTLPRAGVLMIGAVVVSEELNLGRAYAQSIQRADAYVYGLVDRDTLDFWKGVRQSDPDVYDAVWGGTRSAPEVAEEFAGWVREIAPEEIWARGPQYDICALEHLFRETYIECPWKYNQVRDLRTLTALFPDVLHTVERPTGWKAHDAYNDASLQALHLVAILKHLQRVEELQL